MSPAAENDPVLRRIAEWASGRDDVRAVILTSTRAMPDARLDEFSDYDVVLYVTDVDDLAEHSDWFADMGPVLVWWEDEDERDGGRYSMRLVIYDDGTKIDFSITGVAALDRIVDSGTLPDGLDVGYRVLLDRDGRAARLPPPTFRAHIPRRPTEREFRTLVEEFWFESTYVAKNLWRGELLPARYSLDCVMRDDLRRMLEWRMETDHGWSVRPGVAGKGLKQRLDAAIWAEPGVDLRRRRDGGGVGCALQRGRALPPRRARGRGAARLRVSGGRRSEDDGAPAPRALIRGAARIGVRRGARRTGGAGDHAAVSGLTKTHRPAQVPAPAGSFFG